MSSADEAKLVAALTELSEGLSKDHLRTIQRRTFLCSAECCDRTSDSHSQVNDCFQRCNAPLITAQRVLTEEIVQFQDRINRCTMDCNDKARDLFYTSGKESEVRSMVSSCVGTCVDEHINLIPSMTRRIAEGMSALKE